jgi:hypothetical protein
MKIGWILHQGSQLVHQRALKLLRPLCRLGYDVSLTPLAAPRIRSGNG